MNSFFGVNITSTLIMGVLSGIVSSIIIYLLVFNIKPKIKISDNIAKTTKEEVTIYKIKIVNCTKFAIFNLNYSLCYCTEYPDKLIDMIEIPPSKKSLLYIPPFMKNDLNDKHAVRISYKIDTEKYPLTDNTYFCFTISATHGFSNTSLCLEKNYYNSDIIDGNFETGNSLKVLHSSTP